MAISIDSTMQELEKIQMLLHPKKNLENNAVYGCDCTGCSNVLASGDNRHSGSGEKRQFWSTENSHLQFE